MTCSRGRVSPSSSTKLRLFAESAGYCCNPLCRTPLFSEDRDYHIAEIAHIISAGAKGPRANEALSSLDLSQFDNLILLCPNCHTRIDKDEDFYPEEMLAGWKQDHGGRIRDVLSIRTFPDRGSARSAIERLLLENRQIHAVYGPDNDYRHNPESEVAAIWQRKVKSKIIPSSQHLVLILDANRALLTDSEMETVEQYRQHVDDLIARHIAESQSHGILFPPQLNSIFLD